MAAERRTMPSRTVPGGTLPERPGPADLDDARPVHADPDRELAELPAEHGWVLAILGGSTRKGAWEPPESMTVVALMGGVELDFRDAALADLTEIDVYAVMGGVMLKVPGDVAVETHGHAIMGGFEQVSRRSPGPDAPLLRVRGLSLMGGVEIKTG